MCVLHMHNQGVISLNCDGAKHGAGAGADWCVCLCVRVCVCARAHADWWGGQTGVCVSVCVCACGDWCGGIDGCVWGGRLVCVCGGGRGQTRVEGQTCV